MWTLLWVWSWEMQRQPVETGGTDHEVCPFSIRGKMVLSQVCDGARWASCPRWASLQVSQAIGRKKVRRSSRDGAPREQRAKPGTTAKAWRKGGAGWCKVAEGIWEEAHGEGWRVRSLGSSRCSVGHWRETSKVAPSPGEALLVLFSPGPVECISAQVFLEVRAALLASACDLQLAANLDANATSQTSTGRADGRVQGIKSHLPKAAHTGRGQLIPSALPSTGGKPSCKSNVVKQQTDQ